MVKPPSKKKAVDGAKDTKDAKAPEEARACTGRRAWEVVFLGGGFHEGCEVKEKEKESG